MRMLSVLVKFMSISLVIVLFVNSVGRAMESNVPKAQVQCGEWKIKSAGSSNDKRIGVQLLQQATGSDCSGSFTLSNQTGIIVLGGGYAMQLKVTTSNAIYRFLPQNEPLLLPGFDIKLQSNPINVSTTTTFRITTTF